MFKELFVESSDIEKALAQVIQTTAGDARAAGLDVAETAIDNFDNIIRNKETLKKWDKLSYKEKMKIAKKVAKEY